jgi:hypothetical protein
MKLPIALATITLFLATSLPAQTGSTASQTADKDLQDRFREYADALLGRHCDLEFALAGVGER